MNEQQSGYFGTRHAVNIGFQENSSNSIFHMTPGKKKKKKENLAGSRKGENKS